MRLIARGGLATTVSPLLAAALGVAARAAATTGGLVDPTVGGALVALGYDRDYAEVRGLGRAPPHRASAPGWRTLDRPATAGWYVSRAR